MSILPKKYKIVNNVDQYAGFNVPEQYKPMIQEITFDIRDVLLIIFNYEELFERVKAYFISKIPPNIPLVKGFIKDIKYKTVYHRLEDKAILRKIENLLKKLLKIYLKKIVEEVEAKDLTKKFISLVGYIINAEGKAFLINTFLVGWIPFKPGLRVSFDLLNYYQKIYPRTPEQKEEIKKFLIEFMDRLNKYDGKQDFLKFFIDTSSIYIQEENLPELLRSLLIQIINELTCSKLRYYGKSRSI
jgi:hypothetical protein